MLTSFGKFLRKLRIDHAQILKDMSDKLNVTVAYLSAVENGKRDVPEKWLDIIKDEYGLADKDYIEMQNAAYENKDNVNLRFNNANDRDLVLSFARRFDELSSNEKQDILNVLNRKY